MNFRIKYFQITLLYDFISNMSIFRHNRKMSQSELSSVGSESPGNSGRDERGSLIGERGRSTQRNRNINRAASKGKGSSIGKRDPGDPGEKRNLAEAGNPFPGFP